MLKIDLNCDLGESFGNYKIGLDEQVIQSVSSVNIACGWHAGDPVVLEKTIRLAKENGVAVGAHPGFPDLLGFGRRNMAISTEEAYAYTKYQLGAFYAFAKTNGMTIQHVKPHGAFYNMAGKDQKLAQAICKAIYDFDREIILLALAGSRMIEAAEELGMKAAQEFFADRAYDDDGNLAPRSMEGSVIHDTNIAISRVITMIKTGKVVSFTGKEINLKCDSICVHGDNSSAVEFVRTIRERLIKEGICIAPLHDICK